MLGSCELIHNASLILDDIEDKSLKRRGEDCAYIKHGLDVALNAGFTLHLLPQARLHTVLSKKDPLYAEVISLFSEEITCMALGQNWDIDWHNCRHMPNEKDYFQMTSSKTGVIPRCVARLVCAISKIDKPRTNRIADMTNKLGIAFQIQDDLIALESDEYAKARGIAAEDIHEGKRTLMVIHAYNNLPTDEGKRLIEILDMHTEDPDIANEAIDLMNKVESIQYAKDVSENLIER